MSNGQADRKKKLTFLSREMNAAGVDDKVSVRKVNYKGKAETRVMYAEYLNSELVFISLHVNKSL